MADKSNDPVAMWQNMIGEMEKGFNAFATRAMESPEFSKVVNQVGGVSAGAQKQLGEMMEKYLVNMNLPSRAQMVSMAERLQSIEGQLNEIKAMLHQVHGIIPARRKADIRPRRGRRAPGGRRHRRAESKNERAFRPRSGIDPGTDSVRGATRDPAQHQGRRIYFVVRPLARLDAEGHFERPRHDESLSLPADRRRNLPRADPDRDGDHQPRLYPRHGARPELHRVSPEARLRRLHAGLDRAAAGREILADGGLRPRLHSPLRPRGAARFRRDRRHRDRLLFRRRAVLALRLDLRRRTDEEPDLLHHARSISAK